MSLLQAEGGSQKRNYKKKKFWSATDEDLFLDLWKEKLNDLRGPRQNREVYMEMSEQMRRYGCDFTEKEINFKVHNITNKYRREAKQRSISGEPSDWVMFQKVHALLGGHSACKEEILVDESYAEVCSLDIDCKFEEVMTRPEQSPTPSNSDVPSSAEAPEEPTPKRYKLSKKRKTQETVIDSILKEYRHTNLAIIEERRHVREVDMDMLDIERERNDILREFVSNAKDFQENVTRMLQKLN